MNSDGLKRYAEAGYPIRPWQHLLDEHRPVALNQWLETMENVDTAEISEKEKLFVIIAIDAVDAWPGLKPFMHKALEIGATVQELVDVCLVTGWLKGPHALNYGLTTLYEVVEERRSSNRPVRESKDG